MRRCAIALAGLVLLAPTARGAVSGRVVTRDAEPLAGATVRGYTTESEEDRTARLLGGRARVPVATVRTAVDGTFRLETRYPLLWLEVRADGFAPAFDAILDGATLPVSLSRAEIRHGVVRAAGKPVAGATVVWLRPTPAGWPGETMARTGPDGSFDVPDPHAWAHQGLVLHSDFAPLEASPGNLRKGATLELELQSGVSIEGAVVDDTGKPVVDATVAVGASPSWPLARTGPTGTFRIPHAPRDWQALHVRSSATVGTYARKAGPITIVARPGRSISGAVREENGGGPLPGATVSIASETGPNLIMVTDNQGQYTAGGLSAGRHVVRAFRRGYRAADDGMDTDPLDFKGARTARRDFVLTRLPVLSGRVEDEGGRPVDNALVTLGFRATPHVYMQELSNVFGQQDDSVRTSADGSFTLTLPEAGDDANGMMKDRPVIVLKPGYAAARVEARSALASGGAPVVVTLIRGIEIEGRVTSVEGSPIAGVGVTLAEDGSFAGSLLPIYVLLGRAPGEGWTTTDAAGRFSARVHPAIHHVAFRKPGHAPKVVRGHDPRRGDALVVALDAAAVVSGRVAHADGRGVPEVSVSLSQGMAMDDGEETNTASDGSFEFLDLAPGSYELTAASQEMGIRETRTVEAPGAGVQIVLPPGVTLRGRVVDGAARQPVTSFQLAVEWHGDGEDRVAYRNQDVEERSGAFAVADVPAGEVALRVTAEGYAAKRVGGIAVLAGAEISELEIPLDTEVPIRGRVTGDGTAGAAGARVDWHSEDRLLSASATVDEEGDYDLRGVPPGPATLRFGAPGFLAEKRTIDSTQTSQVDVTLRRGLTLPGEVLREGAGVGGAVVSARSSVVNADAQSARTDARGRFTLEGLVPGRYTLSASAPGKGNATLADVDVESSGPVRLILQQAETAVLTGRVRGLGASEGPLMAAVMVQNEEGGMAQGLVDAAHTFRVEDAPAGRVTVSAHAGSMNGTMRSSRTVELTLVAGSEHETVLDFPTDTVSGVVTRDGGPVPNVTVSFEGERGSTAAARTDAGGAYEVVGLEPGPHTVSVSGEGVSFSTEHVVSGSGQLDIDVTSAGLQGRAVAADTGTPIAGVDVSSWRIGGKENAPAGSASTNARGEFVVRSLREGRYRLITSKKGFGQEVREVEVTRGATPQLLLELSPATGLSVAVVDARDGRPLEAIVVVRDASRHVVANRHSGVDDDGNLNIPLANGSYLLSTSASGYGTATLPVTAPAEGLRVGLTPGGTLVIESPRDLRARVRLVQPDGEEYVQCWCNGIAEIQLKGRRTTVENVAPGSYTLELVDGGATVSSRTLVITEGQRSTVTIE